MSQPPASKGYPPLPKGIPQLPPFPQLLHLKDSPSSRSARSHSEGIVDDDSSQIVMSGDEEEQEEVAGPKEVKKEKKPHATRRRVVQSCSECRRRKIKCDKKFPCGPCILRQDQARCHEVGTAEKQLVASSNYATTQDLANLAHRVDALEAALVKSGSIVPADLESFLSQIRTKVQTTQAVERPHSGRASTGLEDDDDNVSDTEGAALTLEHLAFGRSRVDGSHSLPVLGGRKESTISKAPGQGYHLARSGVAAGEGDMQSFVAGTASYDLQPARNEEERRSRFLALSEAMAPMDVFDMCYKRTDIILNALTRVLPTKERGELLVNAFLLRVDWLHRVLHVPTFLSQCRDLWALPQDRVVYEISMPFLAIYLVVITQLGLHFMDSAETGKHFSPEEVSGLSDIWYAAARSAQWASDFMGTHTLENLQATILMTVLMNNRDRADAAWALLGAAIKIAQGLGISRLGAEQQSVEGRPLPMWKGRWESLIQREVGRRIWWQLVFLDWSLAPSYNYASSIQPDQIKTALPANIEDEDLVDDQPLRPQPVNVRTRMSFQLAKLKFAEISQRQIWQANNNNHPPYSFILSVDRELRKAMLELPAFFQPDGSASIPQDASSDPKKLVEHYEKITLSLAIHSRMLRLHRPWLSRGYEDERFAYSKEQCIRAARASLRMMSDDSGVARFLEKWWIPLFYVTVSGMVVIIDLLKTTRREMKSKTYEEKVAEVKGALNQMRQIESSVPARAAVKVMDFLMSEVEERRRPSGSIAGQKRKIMHDGDVAGDDEEHNLQRAVKRLIRQAQLETDSPVSNGATSFVSPSSENMNNPSPSKGDPTPERPVFGAYPMPSSQTNPPQAPQPGMGDGTPAQAMFQGQLGMPNQMQGGFNFNVDPSSANAGMFGNLPNPSFQQGSQLDPTVESMLASYFPPPQTSSHQGELGPAGVAQVPDDFLSRVFSFSWDNNSNSQNQSKNQNPQTSSQQTPLTTSTGSTPNQQQINLGNGPVPGMLQQPRRQDSIPEYGAFDWQTHSWMA
ncbi:uncharacterized protein CcaverHIS019_0304160 [Cutaneotrichosporon cavernicola]|uniref:Zn(2)-C6 fungal-type domain-containing protein n=1 Tax=Cutaneotrichosporon cavernicola TaxID=279322 RepID=A0AA48IFA9_9TREE|nr:uncharacterized protein CcaverHIS019_0304160 [Cutaneotrichosporon cavernicola]BEI90346.1 hypothetical protein CcaverHIS019_0304160 [Cutaneotrichosporon cavernicola]